MKRKSREQKLFDAVMDCYRELYKESTPSADFDKLMEEAPLNEIGQKVIDYMAYSIPMDKYDEIIEKHINKNKLKGYEARGFRIQMYLGCGPATSTKK